MVVKRNNAGKRNRIIAVVVTFSMLMITLAGCGNGGTSVNDNTGNASLHMNESGQSGAQSADSTAMGRYVEEIIDLSDRIGYASHIYQMNDGNLLISDNVNAFLVSHGKRRRKREAGKRLLLSGTLLRALQSEPIIR